MDLITDYQVREHVKTAGKTAQSQLAIITIELLPKGWATLAWKQKGVNNSSRREERFLA